MPAAAMLEGLPDAVVVCLPDERIVFVNRLAEQLFGYSRDELVGRSVQMLWPEHVRAASASILAHHFATQRALRFTTEARGLKRDGTEFIGEMSWGVVHVPAGPLMLAIGRDITGRVAAEARLRALARLGERALAETDAATVAGDAVGLLAPILPVSGVAIRLADGTTLASEGELGEAPLRVSVGGGDELLLAAARELDPEERSLVRAAAATLAVALARLRDEARVRHDAVHDPLTGLPNRTLLEDRLAHALAKSRRGAASAAVLFVDLDEFKQINDRHGHRTGDLVLVELARRLGGAIRPGDTVARFGGDEFVAVCEDVDEATAMMVGVRILEAVQRPFRTDAETTHALSASVGIALGRDDPATLLAAADAAVYRAKAAGRGRVELA